MEKFNAVFLEKNEQNEVTMNYRQGTLNELSQGDVLIKVAYSDVNYKDALASKQKSGIIRQYPMIPGIDLSGTVISSSTDKFQEGDQVLITGYGLGVDHTGGYSELAAIPQEWIVPLPEHLSLRSAMLIGTAGYTAALSIDALEKKGGMKQENQPNILVTGASGGVGSIGIAMLRKLGYTNITALSRKKNEAQNYFNRLGAKRIMTLEDITPDKKGPLMKQTFDFVLDTVGGKQLEIILPQISYSGSISLCGNAGGASYASTVLPHILRGINILGIDSVNVPYHRRLEMWQRLASDMLPAHLEQFLHEEIKLSELPLAFENLLAGTVTGRYLVKIQN